MGKPGVIKPCSKGGVGFVDQFVVVKLQEVAGDLQGLTRSWFKHQYQGFSRLNTIRIQTELSAQPIISEAMNSSGVFWVCFRRESAPTLRIARSVGSVKTVVK